MDGVFKNRKTAYITGILCLIAGVYLISIHSYRLFMGFAEPNVRRCVFFLCCGVIAVVSGVLTLSYNHGAYLHMTENGISAKSRWRMSFACSYSEIAFVTYGIYSLIVRLKSGEIHTVSGITNGRVLCDAIREKWEALTDPEARKTMMFSELNRLAKERRRETIRLVVLMSLIFLLIPLCNYLTGFRELPEFTRQDWVIFIPFLAAEIGATVLSFLFAEKFGEKNTVQNGMRSYLKELILYTSPLLPGNPMVIYFGTMDRVRITVYGLPRAENVYYCIEFLDRTYQLVCIYRSQLFSCIDELRPLLDEMEQAEYDGYEIKED